MKTRIESDDLRTEGLDVESIDLGVADLDASSQIDLGTSDMKAGLPGPPMRIEQDKTDPTLWNLLDWKGKCHGTIPVPREIHVISAIYDNTTESVSFRYNSPDGEKHGFELDLSQMKEAMAGNGLVIGKSGLEIQIAPGSRKCLSVSEEGLSWDASQLFLGKYNDTEYPDY